MKLMDKQPESRNQADGNGVSQFRDKNQPPVIVIGGGANALSIARVLGRRGIEVYAINRPGAAVCSSRFARRIDIPHDQQYVDRWTQYLIGEDSKSHHGSVLLAASDVGLEIIANHREKLQERFLLDESDPVAQLAMLDKLATYRIAVEGDVPTPKFWTIQSAEDLQSVRDDLVYPLLVKPKSSYAFTDKFKGKFFVAESFDDVETGCNQLVEAGVDFLLMEKIPGPDDLLCSYYTYLDQDGNALFDFTKRIIRRNPPNMGLGCYHITDWNPEVKEVALKLFRAVGLRGLCNAEFKLDQRDGTLKLIECNARFTEANGLIHRSGLDLASYVYNRIVGLPVPPVDRYQSGVRLWYPMDDFRSFLALRRQRQLSFLQWIRSLCHWKSFPLFQMTDPMPSWSAIWRRATQWITGTKQGK